jgi:hypothetical protein
MKTEISKEQVFDNLAKRSISRPFAFVVKWIFRDLYNVILESMSEYQSHINGPLAIDWYNEKKKVAILTAALEKVKIKVDYMAHGPAGDEVRAKKFTEIYKEVYTIASEATIITK